jgi:hypothetical protein
MSDQSNMNDRLKALINCLSSTQENEADCMEFDTEVDCLAEMIAAGAPASVIKPKIAAHIEHSPDCREEFDALVAILKAERDGELVDQDTPL